MDIHWQCRKCNDNVHVCVCISVKPQPSMWASAVAACNPNVSTPPLTPWHPWQSWYIYTYIYIWICAYVYTHMYNYVHIYIYTYIPIYIYLYIHTYVYRERQKIKDDSDSWVAESWCKEQNECKLSSKSSVTKSWNLPQKPPSCVSQNASGRITSIQQCAQTPTPRCTSS